MNFLKKFGIPWGSKKNKLLPQGLYHTPMPEVDPTIFAPTEAGAYQTLATFDLTVEQPKYQGAIPEATIKFYPLQ